MRKVLGALVFVVGVAGLGYWGAKTYAVSMEEKIATGAQAVVAGTTHAMTVHVSGRDITLSGIADTQAELEATLAGLDAVRGRRVVNADAVEILPEIDPYETALSKGADGSIAATGYAPSAAARDRLAARIPALARLPLGHGAPEGWADALAAGNAALAPLQEGSAALTGSVLSLAGIAATPVEAEQANAALAPLDGFETIVAIDVIDPGIVDFELDYDATTGFRLNGTVPKTLGRDGFAAALGAAALPGDVETTFADFTGFERSLSGLGANLELLESFEATGTNAGLRIAAQVIAGLDAGVVKGALSAALGPDVALSVEPASAPPDGAERVNAATGRKQFAYGGVWMNAAEFDPTKAGCTEAARATVEAAPIRFMTGSAELDPVSLATINNIAGIIHLCTRDLGMRVVIGGHTDAQGNDAANYSLSVARARAVRDALAARGINPVRMTAVGYGETEPVADNATEEGRAANRRITFDWPN